jgi:hypothetical protein
MFDKFGDVMDMEEDCPHQDSCDGDAMRREVLKAHVPGF